MDYDDHGDHDHDNGDNGDDSEYLVPRADTDRIISCPLATHRGKIRRADKDLWNCMYTVYMVYVYRMQEF